MFRVFFWGGDRVLFAELSENIFQMYFMRVLSQ